MATAGRLLRHRPSSNLPSVPAFDEDAYRLHLATFRENLHPRDLHGKWIKIHGTNLRVGDRFQYKDDPSAKGQIVGVVEERRYPYEAPAADNPVVTMPRVQMDDGTTNVPSGEALEPESMSPSSQPERPTISSQISLYNNDGTTIPVWVIGHDDDPRWFSVDLDGEQLDVDMRYEGRDWGPLGSTPMRPTVDAPENTRRDIVPPAERDYVPGQRIVSPLSGRTGTVTGVETDQFGVNHPRVDWDPPRPDREVAYTPRPAWPPLPKPEEAGRRERLMNKLLNR